VKGIASVMDKTQFLSMWISVIAILVVGGVLLLVLSKAARYLSKQLKLEPIAARPVGVLLRWLGVLVILGMLVNRLFGIDVMGLIMGALALVAIGVVAVWSMLSHITATLLLILLKPFQIGHWIGFAGEEVAGKVVDVNLFFTRLENTETGEHYFVPNNQFFQKAIRRTPGKGEGRAELREQLSQPDPESTGSE
jgi:small-conductance mechanosensitive channel